LQFPVKSTYLQKNQNSQKYTKRRNSIVILTKNISFTRIIITNNISEALCRFLKKNIIF